MIKLIIIILTVYIAIRVGRAIRSGIMTFKVVSSNISNKSGGNSNSPNKIEEAEFEDITDEDNK